MAARDAAFALLLAALFLVASTWLDSAVASRAPAGSRSVGVVADGHLVTMTAVYGSFARESAEGGGLLVHNHQTALPHAPAQARPWDFLLGKVVGALGWGPRAFFLVDRAVVVVAFALAFSWLLGRLVSARAVRWSALVAAFTGGSLYWVWIAFERAPLRSLLTHWNAEVMGGLSGLGFAFPALLAGVPHLMLELVFLCAAFRVALAARGPRPWGAALLAGFFIAAHCSVRPYTVPVSLAAVGGLFLYRRAFVAALLAGLPVLPLLWHYYGVVRGDSVFSSLDVYHPAPSALEQLVFFGLPVLPALALLLPGVRARLRERGLVDRDAVVLFGLWAAANLFLVHGERWPGPLRIGWEVEAMLPLPLLVLVLGAVAADALPRRALAVVLPLFLALHAVPSWFYVTEALERAQDPNGGLLLYEGESTALERLSLEAAAAPSGTGLAVDEPSLVLLCHNDLARLVPWLAGVRVYYGHPDHVPDAVDVRHQVEAFYRDGRGLAELQRRGVTHVLWGPREKLPAYGADLRQVAGLEVVFEASDVTLFRVDAGAL